MKPEPGVLLKRRIVNSVMVSLFTLAVIVSLAALVAILWKLCFAGIQALSLDVFLKSTPAPGTSGGLLNAIVGSVVLVVTA